MVDSCPVIGDSSLLLQLKTNEWYDKLFDNKKSVAGENESKKKI